MVSLSQIDEELSVYNGKRIIIWGCGSAGRRIYQMLTENGIEVEAFCDTNEKFWDTYIEGRICISPSALCELPLRDVLIQIGSTYETEILQQICDMGIDSYIYYSEAIERLSDLRKYKLWKKKPEILQYYIEHISDMIKKYSDASGVWGYFLDMSSNDKDYIVLCMPPKTGDHTIQATLESEGISYTNFWHSSCHYTDELRALIGDRKLKIITAVRDPVAQNLSLFFQRHNYYYWNRVEYWENGGDVQKLFDLYMEEEIEFCRTLIESPDLRVRYNYDYPYRIDKAHNRYTSLVQYNHEVEFKKGFDIDLYQYPFDKEKGFQLFKEGNIEVYIYQLEKLNSNYREFFSALGIDVKMLCTEYQAEKKWYYSSYKEAQKRLVLKQDYLDECYNSQYMRHFYNDEDIQRFKEKWSHNI